MARPKISYIKIDPRKKVKMKVAAAALQLAKEKKDPIYTKYKKIRKKMFKLRKLLVKRYGPKVIGKVRKKMGLSVRAWD